METSRLGRGDSIVTGFLNPFVEGVTCTEPEFSKVWASPGICRHLCRRCLAIASAICGGPEELDQTVGVCPEGIFTVEYPEEKLPCRAFPLHRRFWSTTPETRQGLVYVCGICAKVCPPQCIWIVRANDPRPGGPMPEPDEFYIDIDICMNCGFCAEFCPFDAIKMDHDYEIAAQQRTPYSHST